MILVPAHYAEKDLSEKNTTDLTFLQKVEDFRKSETTVSYSTDPPSLLPSLPCLPPSFVRNLLWKSPWILSPHFSHFSGFWWNTTLINGVFYSYYHWNLSLYSYHHNYFRMLVASLLFFLSLFRPFLLSVFFLTFCSSLECNMVYKIVNSLKLFIDDHFWRK